MRDMIERVVKRDDSERLAMEAAVRVCLEQPVSKRVCPCLSGVARERGMHLPKTCRIYRNLVV